MPRSTLTLAAQLYTLRGQMQTPDEIREGLCRVREIGYTSVQVSGIGTIAPAALRELCAAYGLTVCATHTPLDDILGKTDEVAAAHQTFGCGLVGVGSGGEAVFGETASLESYRALAEKLNEAGEKLRRRGLRFAYHNHSAEFRRLDNGRTGFDFLLENTDPSLVGFIPDTYWIQAGGVNPAAFIRRLRGRAAVVHFKDMAVGTKNKSVFAEIGGGNLDWPAIIDACMDTGVKTAAVEQDICPRDPFDCLRASYDYLHSRFGLN